MIFCNEKQSQLINRFLYKNVLFYDDRTEITCKTQGNFQITAVLKITLGEVKCEVK